MSLTKTDITLPALLIAKEKKKDIQKQQVLHILSFVPRDDGSLDSCTLSKSYIRIEALVQLSAIEVILQKILDLEDTNGTTLQDDVMALP